MKVSWPALAFAAACWAAGFAAMVALDGHFDVANLAMVLVLVSALASIALPAGASTLAGALGVLAFNWAFIEPRYSFDVALRQHALLLLAMVVVNAVVAAAMARQRQLAGEARQAAARETAQRAFGDRLRDAPEPAAEAAALRERLRACTGVEPSVLLAAADEAAAPLLGEVDANQRAGLWLCLRQAQPLGPGSERHTEQPDTYLPLRGGTGPALGAVLLPALGAAAFEPGLLAHAQALCDQLGGALQRAASVRDAQAAREQAQAQGVRNALLAAISHDYRTPLATMLGAATSLLEQDARLSAEQRHTLAARIADETRRLARMTDNTLQLARLDAPGVVLQGDWESAEELVGAALRHARVALDGDRQHRVRARLEPGLPLLWCDALLMAQLLDNLIDNALKYSPESAPVELLVRHTPTQVVLAVRDRGPGIAPAWRERVFEVFRRGAPGMVGQPAAPERPGSGVGLAVCRAIARAHGGELRLRARGHGGCSFECLLPRREPPAAAQPEGAA